MTDLATRALIDGANAYEELFVPCLVGEWTPRVAEAAKVRRGERVLDVACGTGILAREVASRVAPGGTVVGVDLSPAMLEVAAGIAPSIGWCQGPAEQLPFDDRTFDAVVCQFGLMFFRDRVLALREMVRILVPGGRIAVAVWGELTDAPAYAVEESLIRGIAGADAADPLRAPFTLGDPKALAALLVAAGVEGVEVLRHRGSARFPSIGVMVDLDLRGWLPLMGVDLSETQIRHILEDSERALAPWAAADGTVTSDMPALIATGRRPADR